MKRSLTVENPGRFVRLWPKAMILSAVLLVASVAALLTRGLNLGIDFEGGGRWEVPAEDLGVERVRDVMRAAGAANAKIQVVEDPEAGRRIRVQADVDVVEDARAARDVTRALAKAAGTDPDEIDVTTVGPAWGAEITAAARRALLFFFVVVALYITLRFEWAMAAGALVAVVHDIVITAGVYSVTQSEVTPATVIAFLTILGYSLYDTIVVYDRVAENQTRPALSEKLDYARLVDASMEQVLGRSVNTTVTSLIPVISLLLVGSVFFGAATLRDFAFALFVGLLVGAYSSLFVAAPVLVWLKQRRLGSPRRGASSERRPSGSGPGRRGEQPVDAGTGDATSDHTELRRLLEHAPRPRKRSRERTRGRRRRT
ncbi:MAG: protein translocase subunit SecF [Acidimicrobiales bacterium]|nr:MAG: protein translocase subunit SecF [Acidimicrobiales bacterium]